jgi:cell division protein FtsQ
VTGPSLLRERVGTADLSAAGSPRRPKAPWRIALSAAIVLALVAGLAWIVAFSPVLGVRHVTVRGESLLTAEQVRAAADIGSGTPLLRVRTSAVEARVEALPEVASARVSVTYPSTVTIVVSERVAVGYVASVATPPVVSLIDRTGTAFRPVTGAPAGLPQLTATTAAAVRASAEVAASLPQAIRATVTTITAKSENSVVLTLSDGRSVIWGGSVRNAQKAALLPALLTQDGSSIDVSADGVVVVR